MRRGRTAGLEGSAEDDARDGGLYLSGACYRRHSRYTRGVRLLRLVRSKQH